MHDLHTTWNQLTNNSIEHKTYNCGEEGDTESISNQNYSSQTPNGMKCLADTNLSTTVLEHHGVNERWRLFNKSVF